MAWASTAGAREEIADAFPGISKPHGHVAGNGSFLTNASKPCGAWMTELGCSSSSDLGFDAWAAASLVSSCDVISAAFPHDSLSLLSERHTPNPGLVAFMVGSGVGSLSSASVAVSSI